MESLSIFRQMENEAAFKRVRVYFITHPRKNGHAVVSIAYPADGAGRLKAYIDDCFGRDSEPRKLSKGSAGGYGYDKVTAALLGLEIDGVVLTDHSGYADNDQAFRKNLLKKAAGLQFADAQKLLTKGRARQYRFTNWTSSGPQSVYRLPGLEVLTALGYSVIQAL